MNVTPIHPGPITLPFRFAVLVYRNLLWIALVLFFFYLNGWLAVLAFALVVHQSVLVQLAWVGVGAHLERISVPR